MVKLLIFSLVLSCCYSCKVTGVGDYSKSASDNHKGNTSSTSMNFNSVPKASSEHTNSNVISATDSEDYNKTSSYSSETSETAASNDAGSNIGSRVRAASSSSTLNNLEYRIQLAAVSNLNSNHSFGINNVTTRVDNNKLIYEISGYSNANEAYNYAQTLRKKKAPGAFVTKYVNSSRDFTYDYLKENNQSSSSYSSTTSGTYSSNSSSQSYSTGAKNVIEVIEPPKSNAKKSTKLVIED